MIFRSDIVPQGTLLPYDGARRGRIAGVGYRLCMMPPPPPTKGEEMTKAIIKADEELNMDVPL